LFAAVAFSLAAMMPLSALAQDDIRREGERACGSDHRRLCKKVQGDMAVLGCMQQAKAKLTGKCKKFLASIGQI
jgi:hypothetical protein